MSCYDYYRKAVYMEHSPLHQNVPVGQLIKTFSGVYGTGSLFNVFILARHSSQSKVKRMHSTPLYNIYLWFVLILS